MSYLTKKQRKKLDKATVKAELLFKDGRLFGWKFIGKGASKAVIQAIMHDELPGLPYCKITRIMPIAGGRGEYWIAFPIADSGVV